MKKKILSNIKEYKLYYYSLMLLVLVAIIIFATVLLISRGNADPSACDCAEMSKERIEGKMEKLTKTIEEQKLIEENWDKKMLPCEELIEQDKKFGLEMQDCLLSLLKNDN